jgi:hypothetical protein
MPKGRHFNFVLSGPEAQHFKTESDFLFSGHICISNGTFLVTNIIISSKYVKHSNWIQQAGRKYCLTLTGPSNSNCTNLSALIHPDMYYDIQIVFDNAPPVTTSLWLCWVQAYKDRNIPIEMRSQP